MLPRIMENKLAQNLPLQLLLQQAIKNVVVRKAKAKQQPADAIVRRSSEVILSESSRCIANQANCESFEMQYYIDREVMLQRF